ncbi:MAG: hypothetical protein QG637_1457, partial [Chloroflexota bacterium]|nr:hypothetical protein [Chloroflexota bacterium]
KLISLLHNERRQVAVVATLAFATAVCVAMLAARIRYSGSRDHLHMLWNLFLAWLPLLAALTVYNLKKPDQRSAWLLIAPSAFLWLVFFPNAPYMVTDLLNLRPWGNIPMWYDVLMLSAFAWTGAFLGLVSLYFMHTLVRRSAGMAAGWLFALFVLTLTGFGVYLGRFPRWNSWDLFFNADVLLADIWSHMRDPLAHPRTIVFSGLFSLCITAMYLMLSAMVHLRPETHETRG